MYVDFNDLLQEKKMLQFLKLLVEKNNNNIQNMLFFIHGIQLCLRL